MEKELNQFYNIALLFIFGFFVCFQLIWLNEPPVDPVENCMKIERNISFDGVIKIKTRDKRNHNNAIIILNDDKKVILTDLVWNELRVNDSVIKKQNSTKYQIYRNGRLIQNDLQNQCNSRR